MRRRNKIISVRDLMSEIDQDTYTGQTIKSLVRSFLETIMENRADTVILVKVKEPESFKTLLTRLKYTDTKVYNYGENIDGFEALNLDIPQLKNDEFFVIIAKRFSTCLYWNRASLEKFDLCEGFCSLNPGEVKQIVDYLQTIAHSEKLAKDLSGILQDRRNNEKFTTILRKIVADLENRQRDLICVDSELKEVQEKTEESKKLASLTQLFSTAMHEIRNPLGAIDLHSKIISKKLQRINTEDKQVLNEVTETLGLIRKTTENLEKTLTELLDFSKPLTLEKTELNLEEAVNEIINLIKPSYENKNVGLIFQNVLNNDFWVDFDRAKFHQVIFNILKNALEASDENTKVKVTLTGEQENVYLKISDQGAGIPEGNAERIFKPYFTTKKEGTGLGLAEARKIVEAHDGALYVDPKIIEGTTFVMSLPARAIQLKSI